MLEAVIFDWSGTLSDFGSRAPVTAFVELFASWGVAISLEEARQPMGTDKREHMRRLLAIPRVRSAWIDRHGAEADVRTIDEMYRQLIPLQRSAIASHSQLIPGALCAQQWLRDRRIRIGSTTGYGRDMVEPMLIQAAEEGFVPDCVVTADDVPSGRPAPAGALQNAIQLNVTSVRHCLKVDDTEPGIAEGLNAGMWTAAVAVSGNAVGMSLEDWKGLPEMKREELRIKAVDTAASYGAHFVIDSVADLPAVIAQIRQLVSRGQFP